MSTFVECIVRIISLKCDLLRRSPRIRKIQMVQKPKYTYSSPDTSEDENEGAFKPKEFSKEAENAKPSTFLRKCDIRLLQMSQSQLLRHSLKNNDERILELVFQQANEEVINDIVRKLPMESILPLLKVFQNYIQKRVPLGFGQSKWFKAFFHYHSPFLTSSVECEETLAVMNANVDAKTKSLNKIVQLRGKIEMMLRQANENHDKPQSSGDSKENLKFNVDESISGSSEKLDEMLLETATKAVNVQWASNPPCILDLDCN